MFGLAQKAIQAQIQGQGCHLSDIFFPGCFILCSFSQLLQCMTDHKVVVSKINAQVYAHDDTAETRLEQL